MTDIRFYHLQTMNAEQALPGLVARAHENGGKVLVRMRSEQEVKRLDDLLWTHAPYSFIPHGITGDPMDHPVWITADAGNPNAADTLISVHLELEETGFSLICLMFDGLDSKTLEAARNKWKNLKDSGAELTYWQQTPQGGWEKKA